MDDEYIDYSCSTPLERLSRDVETLLRQWHIIFSDRHVSFKKSNTHTSTAASLSSVKKTPGREKLHLNRTPPRTSRARPYASSPVRSPLRKMQSNSNDNFHTPPRNSKDLYALEDAKNNLNEGVKLIRSGKVMFTTTPANSTLQKDRITVELDLCLWDGPGPGSDTTSNKKINANDADDDVVMNNASNLSLSLRSNCKDPFPKFNVLSNLSSLFSIGQHITLSPSSPSDIHKLIMATIEALKSANHSGQGNGGNIHLSVSEAFMNLGKNSSNIENDVALHTAALDSLSGMLQMALNIATASCDTRIPAFGIWGSYKPNGQNRTVANHNLGEETLVQSVMEVPNWINGGDLFNVASESSVCSMFRKHIEGMNMEVDDNSDNEKEFSDEDGSDDSSTNSPRQVSSPARNRGGTLNIPKPQSPTRNSNSRKHREKGLYLPAFVSGKCHPGGSFLSTGAEFEIHVVPPGVSYPLHCTTLNSFGQLLLQHCPPLSNKKRSLKVNKKFSRSSKAIREEKQGLRQQSALGKVVVSGARHKYTWSKIFQFQKDVISDQDDLLLASPFSRRYQVAWGDFNMMTYGLTWRNSAANQMSHHDFPDRGGLHADGVDVAVSSIEQYRQECRLNVLKIFYKSFSGAKSKRARKGILSRKKMEPLWGPFEDPINLVSVDVTWSCKNDFENPLLTLPLRIRSQHGLSSEDVLEMENTILSTVFNPLSVASSDFRVGTTFDANVASTTLSASNRCLLASFIRACSLDQSYLMGHLTNSSILEELHERDELDLVADEIMNEGNVSPMTRKLVEAMEWAGMADEIDDDAAINENRMQDIVEQLHVACAEMGQLPSPPEEMFHDSRCESREDESFRTSMAHASRPGRFLSILFTSMSGLQTPSSMAALWIAFTSDLRLRWERKDKLHNLGHIPGVDGEDVDELNGKGISQGRENGPLNKNVSNGIGSKAKNAAFIHSTENEPNLNDCIINQKLHVFNIGVETMISTEMKRIERENAENDKLTAVFSDDTDLDLKSGGQAPPQSIENDRNAGLDSSSDFKSTIAGEDDFFDAVGTIYNEDATMRDLDMSNDASFATETGLNMGLRRGARCPVHSASLSKSKGQLFAPYVQRDTPLTDDLIIERRKMFSRKGTDNSTIHSRIEAAHRLQKKKLVRYVFCAPTCSTILFRVFFVTEKLILSQSDMSSFKSANPGAVFQDFISWYGNPENPLHQYEEEQLYVESTSVHGLISPTKTVEDEAFEALYILDATRKFWCDCWDESTSECAEDQKPLFDAFSTVEMLLLWFESIHPAILINQILGVNIAMANFVLQTSATSLDLRPVNNALLHLESKTSDALLLLNKDVIKSMSNPINASNANTVEPFAYVSPETIMACESVVTTIGDVEILLSRATSLSTKLNNDKEMVQMILEAPEGRILEIPSCDSRSGILDQIYSQQRRNGGNDYEDVRDLPFPSVREYTIRNRDDQHPCQLTTCIGGTFGLEDGGANSTKGGLVLALKKCSK